MSLARWKRVLLFVIVFSLAMHVLQLVLENHGFGSDSTLFSKQKEHDDANVEHRQGYLNLKKTKYLVTNARIYKTDAVKFVGGNGSLTILGNNGYTTRANADAVQLYSGTIQVTHDDYLQQAPFKFSRDFKNPCWRLTSGKLSCLPYMYVIGVKKCGTSDLFYKISLHPDFIHPGVKEFSWFSRRRFKAEDPSIMGYVQKFKGAAQTILKNSSRTLQDGRLTNQVHITGEASPSYLHLNSNWTSIPGNENLTEPKVVILDYIKHFTPQAKIIITFRNPIDRLYSDYYHEYGTLLKMSPDPVHFHYVVTTGITLYKNCFRKRSVRSCVYEPSIYTETRIQMQLGIYYIFWEELLRVFPRDQILVLQNKDMHDGANMMSTVYDFLALRKLTREEIHRISERKERFARSKKNKKQGPMLNMTWNILNEFYQPFNKKMAEITGDLTFLYNDGN